MAFVFRDSIEELKFAYVMCCCINLIILNLINIYMCMNSVHVNRVDELCPNGQSSSTESIWVSFCLF